MEACEPRARMLQVLHSSLHQNGKRSPNPNLLGIYRDRPLYTLGRLGTYPWRGYYTRNSCRAHIKNKCYNTSLLGIEKNYNVALSHPRAIALHVLFMPLLLFIASFLLEHSPLSSFNHVHGVGTESCKIWQNHNVVNTAKKWQEIDH